MAKLDHPSSINGRLADTTVFHYNLLQNMEKKRCYKVCGCDIEHMVLGSHIERQYDIDRNNNTMMRKVKVITDGDNGLWLCANHDKMFEYGIIYFIDRTLRLLPYRSKSNRQGFYKQFV